MKASIPCIQKFDAAEEKLKAMNAAKKKAGVDLPRIKDEMKKLQTEIDGLKKNQDVKTETKEEREAKRVAVDKKIAEMDNHVSF